MAAEELQQARARIAGLERHLAEQRADIAELRRAAGTGASRGRAVAADGRPAPGRSAGGEPHILVGLVTAIVVGGAVLATAPAGLGAAPGSSSPEAAAARSSSGPVSVVHLEQWVDDYERGVETGRLEVPDEERAAELGARCARPERARSLTQTIRAMVPPPPDGRRASLAERWASVHEPPAVPGLQLVDFTTCVGCDCCAATPRFAPRHDRGRERDPGCHACSRVATLASLGIRARGWVEPRPMRRHGVILELTRPASVVALGLESTYSGLGRSDGWIGAIARDEAGLPIDADRALAWVGSSKPTRNPPYLLVTACPGEVIARVDVAVDIEGAGVDLAELALITPAAD